MTAEARNQSMSPREVAVLFGVSPQTVLRWEKTNKLEAFRTLGGHHRYRREQVEALFEASKQKGSK